MSEGSDNVLLARAPWIISPGIEFRVGEAVIKRELDGDVEACDRYGCARARVTPELEVRGHPIPAVYRLFEGTPYIYVEFEDRLYVEGDGRVYWTLAPYDIEVYVGDVVLVRISPVRVKFTLVGDVVEGVLARHYKAPVVYRRDDLPDPTGTAVVAFRVKGDPAILPGIGFNAAEATLYVDEAGFLYYPVVEVESNDGVITAKVSDRPPVDGVKPLVRARRRLITLQQAAPFMMTVDVVRRRLVTP